MSNRRASNWFHELGAAAVAVDGVGHVLHDRPQLFDAHRLRLFHQRGFQAGERLRPGRRVGAGDDLRMFLGEMPRGERVGDVRQLVELAGEAERPGCGTVGQ